MKQKMTKDIVPEGFTLGLTAVDAVPVVFFGATFLRVGILLKNPLFITGAALCLIGGAGKVLWKLIVVLKEKNVWPLFVQMRILMPLGFALMIASLFIFHEGITFAGFIGCITAFPSVIFFALGVIGMLLMMVFSVTLNSADLKSNWIEQVTNGVSQICFFTGVLLL